MWCAAADRGDRRNDRAKQLLTEEKHLVTSDHVLVETWSLRHHRLQREAAERNCAPRGLARRWGRIAMLRLVRGDARWNHVARNGKIFAASDPESLNGWCRGSDPQ